MAEQPMIQLGQPQPLEGGSDLVLPNGQLGGAPLVPGAAADQRRRIQASYRAGLHPRLPATARLREALFQGSERGLIVRWDPVTPPADAQAALTVAGRLPNGHGKVGDFCPVSRGGLGPDEMLKPELSWVSVVQVIGGRYGRASSCAAVLVSRLAAHTWAHLRQPSRRKRRIRVDGWLGASMCPACGRWP